MAFIDISWAYRFDSFNTAFNKLEEAIIKEKKKADSRDKDAPILKLLKDGVIHRFEYTHELAWNVMKDFLVHAGNTTIFGSKDATREAFAAGLIMNGDVWMDMIKSRNKTSHTYNEETADEIFMKIVDQYLDEYLRFRDKMEDFRSSQQQE
jgi:nucleotidyltransferase substrate binding protein (TIGR01987 family)